MKTMTPTSLSPHISPEKPGRRELPHAGGWAFPTALTAASPPGPCQGPRTPSFNNKVLKSLPTSAAHESLLQPGRPGNLTLAAVGNGYAAVRRQGEEVVGPEGFRNKVTLGVKEFEDNLEGHGV